MQLQIEPKGKEYAHQQKRIRVSEEDELLFDSEIHSEAEKGEEPISVTKVFFMYLACLSRFTTAHGRTVSCHRCFRSSCILRGLRMCSVRVSAADEVFASIRRLNGFQQMRR